MPKRDKRSMIFGIGLGVVSAVAIMFVVYIIQRQVYTSENYDLYQLNIQLAAQLEEAAENGTQPLSDEQIIQRAMGLGMYFPESGYVEGSGGDDEENYDEASEYTPYDDDEEVEDAAAYAPQNTDDTHIWVHIPAGIVAAEIAHILHRDGIVENVDAFLNFLISNGFTVSLMAGDFLLPRAGDFNVIMNQILAVQ